jgi:hypothetical protein
MIIWSEEVGVGLIKTSLTLPVGIYLSYVGSTVQFMYPEVPRVGPGT